MALRRSDLGGKRVMVVGSGGREHALAWKIAKSPEVGQVFAVPGNSGTVIEPRVSSVTISSSDTRSLICRLAAFAKLQGVEWTVVGPESFLEAGIADAFHAFGLEIFAPSKEAARLETSKAHANEFALRHGIPRPPCRVFPAEDRALALEYVRDASSTIVVKADGLASGKGVTVAETREEAEAAVERWLAKGAVLVEEFLEGEEVSFTCVVSGSDIIELETAQDHKRRFAGDRKPNPMTGGMGAVSPAPCMSERLRERIMAEIVEPTVKGLAFEGIRYVGFLYFGLMITADGPKLLEYNCRLGDPEAQAILFRLRSDIVPVIEAAIGGRLGEAKPFVWTPRRSVTTVLVDRDYPDLGESSQEIFGVKDMPNSSVCKVFHASTRCETNKLFTAGRSRVLSVTGLGTSYRAAREIAYRRIGSIRWTRMDFRPDIGESAAELESRHPVRT